MATRAQIVAIARTYVGTAYAHQKRVRGVAVDCVGVPVGVAHELGLPMEDLAAYAQEPNPLVMRQYLDRNGERVPVSEMQAGDVAWIRFANRPQHLAVVCDYAEGGLGLIHAHQGMGAVVEHRLDDVWRARIVGVWRYRGLT